MFLQEKQRAEPTERERNHLKREYNRGVGIDKEVVPNMMVFR